MKNMLYATSMLFLFTACSDGEDAETSAAEEDGTITYESEAGPVEVPANPERIITLTNGPNVLALDGNVVGVDSWTKANPLFTEKLEDVEEVSEENLEKIIELEPDLIIGGTHMNNVEQLQEIAPTVLFTWGELDYLSQQVEIGKLLNKEEEAQDWVEDFEARAKASGEEIKEKHGEDVTVSVFENGDKEVYVFGNNYARGTEILYQAMELEMPEKVEADALEAGVHTMSSEVVPEYAGDYIVLSRSQQGDNSFMETDTWNNIPAVADGNVIEIDTEASTYSDPITLEHLLEVFEEGFLEE
ncbi:iron complex transport system substrate-binding protein [Alkalicoccus daliensis]|uniref:Iron complex transport system substrate-binding protein n=1 Tax=Alkalicoccus daliensis TaxID=745820 RepID=A0A1H0CQN7_9BACI|nr:iron complex transport system substrate-binding protein [Alkalicoccus daliensis]